MTAKHPVCCYIAIGSNQGERLALCEAAIARLAALPQSTLGRRSPWYETEPVLFDVGARAGELSESSRLTDSAARTGSLLLPRRSVRPPLPPDPESAPGWFINGVVEMTTTLAPRTLLDECFRIEQQFGRKRVTIRSHNTLAYSGGDAQLPLVHSPVGARAESVERPPMPPHPEPSPYGDQPPFSRPIDLDLLFYGDAVISEPGLTIPHPRLHARRFVLAPMAELAPGLVHPALQVAIADLLSRLVDDHAVHRLDPSDARAPVRRRA